MSYSILYLKLRFTGSGVIINTITYKYTTRYYYINNFLSILELKLGFTGSGVIINAITYKYTTHSCWPKY